MGKRNSEFRLSFDRKHEEGIVVVNVMKEEDVVESASFDLTKLPPDIKARLFVYGGSQFLSDRASETETGPGKLKEMQGVYEMLASGQFEKARERGAPTVSVEIEAVARHKGSSVAEAQVSLRRYTEEQKKQIYAHPAIAKLIEEIRKEREASTEPLDLSDLGVGAPEGEKAAA